MFCPLFDRAIRRNVDTFETRAVLEVFSSTQNLLNNGGGCDVVTLTGRGFLLALSWDVDLSDPILDTSTLGFKLS